MFLKFNQGIYPTYSTLGIESRRVCTACSRLQSRRFPWLMEHDARRKAAIRNAMGRMVDFVFILHQVLLIVLCPEAKRLMTITDAKITSKGILTPNVKVLNTRDATS